MSHAEKYSSDQLEEILARYEFLTKNCEEFKIAYEWGGADKYYPACDKMDFEHSVDQAIKFAEPNKDK